MNLIDYLANECHCYVSDLKFRHTSDELLTILSKIPSEKFSLEEWLELFNYIFNNTEVKTMEDINNILKKSNV